MTATVTSSERSRGRTSRRWRLLGAIALVAGVAAAAAGVAYGLLPTTGAGSGSASTGSVSLSIGQPVGQKCSYTSLSPGDLPASTNCSLTVTYTGSISAYVSLTVVIQSKAGSGSGRKSLYDGTNTSGLSLSCSLTTRKQPLCRPRFLRAP